MSELIGINTNDELRRLEKRIAHNSARLDHHELLLTGDKKQGINGVCPTVQDHSKYINYMVGGWAVLGTIWAILSVFLPHIAK